MGVQNVNNGQLGIMTDELTETWEAEGKVYTIRTLKIRQWAALEEWVQKRVRDEAKDMINGLQDKDLAKEIWKDAQLKMDAAKVGNPGFLSNFMSLAGMQQIFWMSLTRAHPTMTLAQAGDMIDVGRGDEFLGKFFAVNRAIARPGNTEEDPSGEARTQGASTS